MDKNKNKIKMPFFNDGLAFAGTFGKEFHIEQGKF